MALGGASFGASVFTLPGLLVVLVLSVSVFFGCCGIYKAFDDASKRVE